MGVVRERHGARSVPALPRGTAWLFVEISGDNRDEVRSRAVRLTRDGSLRAVDARLIEDSREAATLWRIRADGAGLAGRSPAGLSAHAGWEDAAQVLRSFMVDAAQLVGKFGGSLSGEHGDGRARGELLPYMYSPAAIDLFRAVKHICDPDNLLNPGILVAPAPLDVALRFPAPSAPRGELAFAWSNDGGDLSQAIHRCTGVGKCRADNTGTGGVMCPSYLATKDEKHSTRGRARLLQEMLNGSWRAAGGRPRCTRPSTSACLARAAPPTARPAPTWRRTRPRCCTRPTAAGCVRCRTTCSDGSRESTVGGPFPSWRPRRSGAGRSSTGSPCSMPPPRPTIRCC